VHSKANEKTRPRGSADIVSSNTSHFEPAVGVEPFRTSLEPPPSVTQKTALSWQCCEKKIGSLVGNGLLAPSDRNQNVITGGDNSRSTHFLAKDLIAAQRIDCTCHVPNRAPFALMPHKQQHDCDSARPTQHSRFYGGKKKSKRATALHRVRDIDSPAPLSGDKM
jgi:hypothetical protein